MPWGSRFGQNAFFDFFTVSFSCFSPDLLLTYTLVEQISRKPWLFRRVSQGDLLYILAPSEPFVNDENASKDSSKHLLGSIFHASRDHRQSACVTEKGWTLLARNILFLRLESSRTDSSPRRHPPCLRPVKSAISHPTPLTTGLELRQTTLWPRMTEREEIHVCCTP